MNIVHKSRGLSILSASIVNDVDIQCKIVMELWQIKKTDDIKTLMADYCLPSVALSEQL